MSLPLLRWCRRAVALLALLPLAACNLGPFYQRPGQAVPARFRSDEPVGAPIWPAPDWWRGFRSPQLDGLIAAAQAHNQNIAVAVAQIREADAAVRIAGAPLLPTVGLSGNQSWERVGKGGSGGGSFTAGTGVPTLGSSRYTDIRSYSLELNASYEIDFWGKNLANMEAAQAAAVASRYNAAVVALTAVTSVATTYFEALGTRDQLAVAQQNLAAAQEVLRAVQGQLSVGTASLLDIAQQQALVDALARADPGAAQHARPGRDRARHPHRAAARGDHARSGQPRGHAGAAGGARPPLRPAGAPARRGAGGSHPDLAERQRAGRSRRLLPLDQP